MRSRDSAMRWWSRVLSIKIQNRRIENPELTVAFGDALLGCFVLSCLRLRSLKPPAYAIDARYSRAFTERM